MVSAETISKCFRKAGALDSSMDIVTRGFEENDEDPFIDSDLLMLQTLIDKTKLAQENCTLDEYLHGDDDLPVCVDIDKDNWEESF